MFGRGLRGLQSFAENVLEIRMGHAKNKQGTSLFELRISPFWDISMRTHLAIGEKPLDWVGSSKRDFLAFPAPVQREIGNALGLAQFGGKHPNAKPWKGEGPGVFEVVDGFDGDTWRAVYTVRFRHVVYVLHAFQKKSPRGKKTARTDIELIARRLNIARQDYEARYGESER
jgi:phage-related protein